MILVIGATGLIGGLVAKGLLTRGQSIRLLVRDESKARNLFPGDIAEIVRGDYDDPESLRRALSGCDSLFLVSADNPRQVQQEQKAASIAVEQGVTHIVKLSSSDAGQRPYNWSVAHAAIEEHIRNLDVSFSFLRPHFFMSNYFSLLRRTLDCNHRLRVSAGNGRITAIDPFDIGECAAELLSNQTPLNDHALMVGPGDLTMTQVASSISDATSMPVEFVDVDPTKYEAELIAESPESGQDVADVYREVRDGTMVVQSDWVSKILGRQPRAFVDFAQDNKQSLIDALNIQR